MILTLVRHGEPARDVPESERGDPPLSPAGRRQLERARALVDADGWDAVYCSPLLRARQSAEVLVPGHDAEIDADLAEFDRGAQRYVHWEDGAEAYRSYLAGDLSPWGTTLREFRARIHAAVERIRADAAGEHVVAVTHGGVISNLFSMLLGSDQVTLFQPSYGSVNRFRYAPDEGWTPLELNATGGRPDNNSHAQ